MKIKLLFCVLALSVLGFGQAAITVTNAGTTGTTVNSLAKINTANNAVITGTSDTTVPAYIVTGGAGTSGLGVLAVAGQASCTMDSTIASSAGGFYVINSVTVGGDCHAQTAAPALGVWVVGYLSASSTTSGSTSSVTVINGWFAGAGIPLSQLASQSANTGVANTTSGSAAPAAYNVPSGIQNYVANSGYNQATAHQTEAPALCSDSSGSGTAQTCTFSPALTPAANDCMTYVTTTTNSGAGLTIAAGGLAAKSVAIPGASGWTTTLSTSPHSILANSPIPMCYDGTNWNVTQTGTASGAVSSVNTLTNAVVIEAATAGQMAVSGGSGAALTGAADMTYVTHTFATTTAGIFDWSAATGTNAFKFPAVIGGSFLGGTSTANLSAPIVIQNTNSSNNNTSITMGITAPGTSTGQTVLNVNGAATGADLADFGTAGTWTNGVLSGQTIVDAFTANGTMKLGTAPTVTTPGTGFYIFGTEGTEPGSIASGTTGMVMDSTSHCPVVWDNAVNMGCIPLTLTRQITGADWSCGTGGTVSSCVAAGTIGTLTWTLPLVAANWSMDCTLIVGQATGVTANNWNLQTATNGATNVEADYSQETAATAIASGVTTGQASTTTTFNIGGTWTQGATGTKMPVHIHATIEGASVSGTVVNLQLVAPTVADLVTIYRGSSCTMSLKQ